MKNMLLKDFNDTFKRYIDDVGIESSKEGYMGSHKLLGSIRVTCENTEEEFEIVGLDLDQLMGCGCFSGIEIIIRKIKDESNTTATL